MSYFLYILFSKRLNKYYTGHTDDLEKRITQHNEGFSDFTSISNDWKLVYNEQFVTRDEARKREAEIKKKKSRKYIEWLISSI